MIHPLREGRSWYRTCRRFHPHQNRQVYLLSPMHRSGILLHQGQSNHRHLHLAVDQNPHNQCRSKPIGLRLKGGEMPILDQFGQSAMKSTVVFQAHSPQSASPKYQNFCLKQPDQQILLEPKSKVHLLD